MASRASTRTRWGAAAMLAMVLQGCGGGGSDPGPVVPTRRAEPVPATDRLYNDDRAVMDSVRVVITNPDEFRTWWTRATAEAGEAPPMPQVDFEEHMVLLVSAGRSNSGDRIRVDSVGFQTVPEPGGGQREVWFAVVRTLIECDPFPGDAYPLEIVRAPRAEPPIDWIEQRTTCPGS